MIAIVLTKGYTLDIAPELNNTPNPQKIPTQVKNPNNKYMTLPLFL